MLNRYQKLSERILKSRLKFQELPHYQHYQQLYSQRSLYESPCTKYIHFAFFAFDSHFVQVCCSLIATFIDRMNMLKLARNKHAFFSAAIPLVLFLASNYRLYKVSINI